MPKSRSEIPVATVTRLALYLRELQQLQRGGTESVRSQSLAERLGLKDSQVRRDLSCLGTVGQRGVGYRVADLVTAIQHVLGTDRSWSVILVGVGNLGRALTGYKGFGQQGFQLVAAFDSDPDKIGSHIGALTIRGLDTLEAFIVEHPIDLAILAVPAESARLVASRLASCGVSGILNFAPIAVPSSDALTIQDVDLAIELQRLAFSVVRSHRPATTDPKTSKESVERDLHHDAPHSRNTP
jgi:redox-sensing transcriptional repressor